MFPNSTSVIGFTSAFKYTQIFDNIYDVAHTHTHRNNILPLTIEKCKSFFLTSDYQIFKIDNNEAPLEHISDFHRWSRRPLLPFPVSFSFWNRWKKCVKFNLKEKTNLFVVHDFKFFCPFHRHPQIFLFLFHTLFWCAACFHFPHGFALDFLHYHCWRKPHSQPTTLHDPHSNHHLTDYSTQTMLLKMCMSKWWVESKVLAVWAWTTTKKLRLLSVRWRFGYRVICVRSLYKAFCLSLRRHIEQVKLRLVNRKRNKRSRLIASGCHGYQTFFQQLKVYIRFSSSSSSIHLKVFCCFFWFVISWKYIKCEEEGFVWFSLLEKIFLTNGKNLN